MTNKHVNSDMRLVKFKMLFSPDTDSVERVRSLKNLARRIVNGGDLNVIDLKHFREVSYIIFENTYYKKSRT